MKGELSSHEAPTHISADSLDDGYDLLVLVHVVIFPLDTPTDITEKHVTALLTSLFPLGNEPNFPCKNEQLIFALKK